MFKRYYRLTKPGIVYGNDITTIAGFLLASKGFINFRLFIATVFGLSLLMASGCVFNNILDRWVDEKMERTKKRELVKKVITVKNALIYGGILGILGILILYLFTNLLTTLIALTGFVFYVGFYTTLKKKTVRGPEIGSISGAVPIVVGYCAVTDKFDLGAFLLFMILVFWQMPHFYAIAIRRLKEYQAAKIPVLPSKLGIKTTKVNMLVYILLFIAATFCLYAFGYAEKFYLGVVGILEMLWLAFSLQGFWVNDEKAWGKRMFLFSLIIITTFSLMISVDGFLPSL